ncbi:hypothetical protein RB597_004470 [Gaeumannomyces tritici]
MALPILPNPSNFLGVALVINRSRDGPSFVFHYPPHVNVAPDPPASGDLDDDEREHGHGHGPGHGHAKDYEYDEGGDFADREQRLAPRLDADGTSPAVLLKRNQDDHLVTESGTQIVPWEHVAGFPTKDLESILTPGRAYHKTLFQLSLDPIYCVSYPIHVPESGSWKKRKKKKKKNDLKKKASVFSSGSLFSTIRDPDAQHDSDAAHKDSVRPPAVTARSDASGPLLMAGNGSSLQDDLDGPGHEAREDEEDEKGGDKEKDKNDKVSSMTMLNLVFFLNPKKHEVKELVNSMYTHIIRQVNKSYKYCQERNDFVWKESKKILALKDKAREDRTRMTVLWHEILAASSLAQSMQDVYETISQNRIAVLQLDTQDGAVTHSVQIPIPLYISDLPQECERDAPGIWLTTANSFAANGRDPAELGFLDKNFGLLLLDEDKKIITELQSDPDESTVAMIEFIRHSKPTLSFHQVASQSNLLSLSQIHQFAHHFIFWRRAVAIPPLHARDIYMLSPNCDLNKLPQASVKFARAFPHCPPLPNILADLSAAPRPYKFFCPNKTIRAEYMRILTWLMRGGWVTQLCTFAYIVVWPEIIYEVEHALEAEELAKAKAAQAAASAEPAATATDSATATAGSGGSAALTPTSVSEERKSSGSTQLQLLSPQPRSASVSTATDGPDGASDDGDAILRSGTASPSELSRPASSSPSMRSPAGTQAPQHVRPQPTAAQQAAEKARLGRLADKAARELAEKASAHARKPQPAHTAHPSVNNAPHLIHLSPHIILDPSTVTGTESLYLSAIGRRLRRRSALPPGGGTTASVADPTLAPGGLVPPPFSIGAASLGHHATAGIGTTKSGGGGGGGDGITSTAEWDERVANTWSVFWKYFNGHCALERIALQEDMKRRDVWALLTAMSEYLLCIRHW